MKRASTIKAGLLTVIMLLSMVNCNDISAQNRSRFVHWMYQDAAGLATSFDQQSPLYAIGTTVSLVALSPAGPKIIRRVQRIDSGAFSSFLDVANRLGDPQIKYPVLTIFAVSLVSNNERFQDAAFTSAQSWIYAGLITMGLKTAIGRARPESSSHPQAFSPFSGNTSFPSGHTTAAFAIITPWVLYYPGTASYALFALSAGTAVSRIAKDKHWPTDVVAGAAVGYLTARFLVRRHVGDTDTRGPRIQITPTLSARAAGVAMTIHIGD